MEKSTSTNNTKAGESQVLAHFAIVSFALFGFTLNLFSQLWESVKQLGSVPGSLISRQAAWAKDKISDTGFSIWQQRESSS